MSWRALSRLNSSSGHSRPYCTSVLIQLPLTLPKPAHSASLIAARSMARLTACRTRLVVERALRVLEADELKPKTARQHRRQHQLRILLYPVDQLARQEVDQVRLAAL